MSAHTEGLLTYGPLSPSEEPGLVATVEGLRKGHLQTYELRVADQVPLTTSGEADARRLAACWNACAGIPTEGLEAGAVSDLLAACKAWTERGWCVQGPKPKSGCACDWHMAKAAVAKAVTS